MSDTENPFESLRGITAFWAGDWSTDKRLAWLYGIISGWDDDCEDSAMREVATRHGWNADAVARLRRLREAFLDAEDAWRARPTEGKAP